MVTRVLGASGLPSYFLISVSTLRNLELCIKHALAGFPGGESGAWTFCEIVEGDFVSFLYGARVHNLYRVSKREALRDADRMPPAWQPLVFENANKVYYFPYRLWLQPVRTFNEPLIRQEFAYIAENLLQRGGYNKTHFQADQTTLQSVSGMGIPTENPPEGLALPEHSEFSLRFTTSQSLRHAPEVMGFRETILQSAIRRYLTSTENLDLLLGAIGLNQPPAAALEVLGEKGLPEGHIDLLLKERVPIGSAVEVPIEVKTKRAQGPDVLQLRGYMDQLRGERPLGALIAADFGKSAVAQAALKGIRLIRYSVQVNLAETPSFGEICRGLKLELAH